MSLFLKLGFLGLKAITKQLSKRVKKEAQRHPNFKRICIVGGRKYQDFVTKTNVRILTTNIRILRHKELTDEEAVELGADFLAEVMIWSAAALQVIGVYYYSMADKAKKDALLDDRFKSIQKSFDALKLEFEMIENNISNIRSYLSIHSIDDGGLTEQEYTNSTEVTCTDTL